MKLSITFKSRSFLIGLVLSIITILLCLRFGSVIAVAILPIPIILTGLISIELQDQTLYRICSFLILLVMSFINLFLTQFVQNLWFPAEIKNILLGMLIYLIILIPVFIISLSIRVSICIASLFLLLLATVNYYIFSFRGNALLPSDILSITTAANVAAEYKMFLDPTTLYAWVIQVMVLFFFLKFFYVNKSFSEIRNRKRTRIGCLLVLVLIIAVFEAGLKGVKARPFLNLGAGDMGFLVNFTKEIHDYSFAKKPDNYSPDHISALEDTYKKEEEVASDSDLPDIIVIMDESYADFNILGDNFNTNIPVSPFIDSLTENTTKGYALSSIFGAGTPNSEYEFLTGNTLAFLPSGAIVYQQYIKEPTYSMISYLHSLDYKCISMHPYLSSGWARPTIYEHFDFDESYYIDDYPQENLFRNYVSDQEDFEELIRRYEEMKASGQENVFIFNVTMQNHGGYGYTEDNYQQSIYLEGYQNSYPDAEQYLTCIHETDKAVEYLINYFAEAEHDVIMVFYGDHLPNINEGLYTEIHGGPFQSLDEVQLKYSVPFFIWTNYESAEEEIELTSLNYLSTYLYQKAGIALPPYNQYLQDVQEAIPAINANGYYSPDKGEFTDIKEAEDTEAEVLNLYNQMEYNDIFDKENRNGYFFPAPQ